MEKVEKEDNKKRARKNNNFNFIRFGQARLFTGMEVDMKESLRKGEKRVKVIH